MLYDTFMDAMIIRTSPSWVYNRPRTSSDGSSGSAMSSWQPNYPIISSEEEDEDFAYQQQYPTTMAQGVQQPYAAYASQDQASGLTPQQIYQRYQMQQLQSQYYQQQAPQQMQWAQSVMPQSYVYPPQGTTPYPHYAVTPQYVHPAAIAAPSGSLYPPHTRPELRRVASETSAVSSDDDDSRGVSPNAAEMAKWGTKNRDGTWSCSHPNCRSLSTFTRGCDLRKHYKRHEKTIRCRYDECPKSREGGFSSNKDRDRHEASHNPSIPCAVGCGKTFSREDNMRDHARRIHGIGHTSGRRGRS